MDTNQEEITQAELIDLFLEQFARDLHKAMPCKVEKYDSSTQTVDVVPALNRSLPDGAGNYVTEKLPKLSAVPVMFQRCQQFTMTFPIAVGDYGLIVICDRNIAAWRATGNQGDPGDLGLHTLDGAVFIPGLFPDSVPSSTADANNMVIGSESAVKARIVLKPAEIDLGAGATDPVLSKGDLGTFIAALTVAIAAVVPNDGGATALNALKTTLTSASWPSAAAIDGPGADYCLVLRRAP